jgi:cytochrome c556
MTRLARALVLSPALLAAAALLAGTGPGWAFDEVEDAQKEILDLAKRIQGGKDVSGRAAAIKKKYEELETVMHGFKPRAKKGIGYDEKTGIEQKVMSLAKDELSADAVKKEKDRLVRMAYVNAAIAEVAAQYAPAKPKGGKGAKEWKRYADDMKKSALELGKAAQAGDPAKLKTAASALNNACNGCHADFRDI